MKQEEPPCDENSPQVPVPDANSHLLEAAERLRTAIKHAGGNRGVSAKSGIPVSTIGTYLAATSEMRLSTAISLAAACGVSLQWLATGLGGMLSEEPEAKPAKVGLYATLDLERFGTAMQLADEIFLQRSVAPPWEMRAQIVAVIYDLLDTLSPEIAKKMASTGN